MAPAASVTTGGGGGGLSAARANGNAARQSATARDLAAARITDLPYALGGADDGALPDGGACGASSGPCVLRKASTAEPAMAPSLASVRPCAGSDAVATMRTFAVSSALACACPTAWFASMVRIEIRYS